MATYRESDSDPKERFLYHSAGWAGFGTSSYIDLVALRDRDANAGWTAASDGTLEERVYYVHNWRADVVALVKVGDQMQEWAKYSAYGVPFGIPGGDTDSDGDCDATDVTQVQTWIDAPAYDVRGDIDLDGDVDATDKSTIQASFEGTTLGRGTLSATGVRNRKGYAGYEFDVAIGSKYHVRHRVLDSGLGRWLARDPAGVDNPDNLIAYVDGRSITSLDPLGLQGCPNCPFPTTTVPQPRIPDSPLGPTLPEITAFTPGCASMPGIPASRADCALYGRSTFRDTSQLCMCMCLPDNPVTNRVRACLLCMHMSGFDPGFSHDYCFAATGYSPLNGAFIECLWECHQW